MNPKLILHEVAWPVIEFPVERNLILAMRRGSESHGLYIPPNEPMGTDDRDVMGVVLPPTSYILGLDQWKQTAEAQVDPWDVVVYDVRHFLRLLLRQNPNVLGMLWLAPEDYLHVDPPGQWLIENRLLFRARDVAYEAFIGYARAQLEKMQAGAHRGYMGTKRKEIVERCGYDTKNAAHLIRLLRMGREYMMTGELQVRRTEDRNELIAIKQGMMRLEEVRAIADIEFTRIQGARQMSLMPTRIDMPLVNDLCEAILRYRTDRR